MSRVRELYAANVVRAPRAGIVPLLVMAKRGDHVEERGKFTSLLTDTSALHLPPVEDYQAPEISGQRSAEVDVNFGAKLAGAFLTALGLPIPGASVEGTLWHGATGFTFEVRDVIERKVDVNALGAALKGRTIDRTNLAAAPFFDTEAPAEMHVITRTLVSRQLTLRATGASGQTLAASTTALTKLIGDVKAQIAWKAESDGALTFSGAEPATFALAAVPCNPRPDGRFTLGLELRGGSYLDTPSGDAPELLEDHLPLFEEDGLLDIALGEADGR